EARKAPIKMLFPLVFLIFPPLYMIMMGPAALQAFRFFVK
ncbi:MAG: secretion system protein, partial [Chloroflexota bacterium]